jgi:hypothetical protein
VLAFLSEHKRIVNVKNHVEFWCKTLGHKFSADVALIKIRSELFVRRLFLFVIWALETKGGPAFLKLSVSGICLLPKLVDDKGPHNFVPCIGVDRIPFNRLAKSFNTFESLSVVLVGKEGWCLVILNHLAFNLT